MQALKEAFEVCDNLLKKGGSEKLSDEAIEDTLEKVLVAQYLLRAPGSLVSS
jgi:hypothetical protein